GFGIADAMIDPETVAFVHRQGAQAKFITSVCTGAFVLGTAGLLQGRRATTHWAFTDLLPLVGATHEKARVVRDGNVFTAGGVTSGIDFALTIVAEIHGTEVAKTIQLGIEYDPAPPFASGHPDRADPAAETMHKTRYDAAHKLHSNRLEHVRQRGGLSRPSRPTPTSLPSSSAKHAYSTNIATPNGS